MFQLQKNIKYKEYADVIDEVVLLWILVDESWTASVIYLITSPIPIEFIGRPINDPTNLLELRICPCLQH
jgi:hypothetical protein